MFHFHWPWFSLLIPLPLLLHLLRLPTAKTSKQEAPILKFPAYRRIERSFPHAGEGAKSSNRLFTILMSLVWVLLIVSLMQPEKVDQFTSVKNVGHDIMVAVDISPSMQALDFSTRTQTVNRLDVTKDVVGEFVQGRQGDRVGLITFGESAYLHVPLTLDTKSVSHLLNDTLPGMAGQSTAIGDAIGLGVRTLRDRPEGSRVLILLTDGEDNSSSIPPIEAAKLAKQYGIKIYTIGVGTNGSVPFPNNFGGYQMVQMSIDEDALREIANITEGQYFHATNKDSLERIYDQIDQLEKTEANTEQYLIRDPYYQYPLGLAVFILFVLILTPLIRSVAHEF